MKMEKLTKDEKLKKLEHALIIMENQIFENEIEIRANKGDSQTLNALNRRKEKLDIAKSEIGKFKTEIEQEI